MDFTKTTVKIERLKQLDARRANFASFTKEEKKAWS
jgi:hypothetical protein